MRIAKKQQVFSGACHGHIQFAVYPLAVFLKNRVGEEAELIILLDGEAIENIVALASLEAFYSINGDVVQGGDAVAVECVADGDDLVAIRHNHAHCARYIQVVAR